MRISDWSSDVCSSDLDGLAFVEINAQRDAGFGVDPGQQPREARAVARARHHAQHVYRAAGEHFIVAHFRIAAAERVTELLDVGKRQVRAPQRPIDCRAADTPHRSEEHTSELQSLMRISYAVFCLKKKKKPKQK